jgi:hypothetical protein
MKLIETRFFSSPPFSIFLYTSPLSPIEFHRCRGARAPQPPFGSTTDLEWLESVVHVFVNEAQL